MPLLLWLIPGGFLIWLLAQRHTEERLRREVPARTGAYYPFPRPPERAGVERRLGPARAHERVVRDEPMLAARAPTTADYLQHLHEATAAAQILDSIKPLAQNADVASLMRAPPEVVEAFHVLSAPLDVLFAQKDMNVLGAQPPLPENGVPDQATREALKAIQARFGQPATGVMDSGSALAIRYAVGCINSQDRAHLAAVTGMGR